MALACTLVEASFAIISPYSTPVEEPLTWSFMDDNMDTCSFKAGGTT